PFRRTQGPRSLVFWLRQAGSAVKREHRSRHLSRSFSGPGRSFEKCPFRTFLSYLSGKRSSLRPPSPSSTPACISPVTLLFRSQPPGSSSLYPESDPEALLCVPHSAALCPETPCFR